MKTAKRRMKKLIALMLGLVTMVSMYSQTMYAADYAVIDCQRMYESDGSQISYHGSFEGTHGSNGEPGEPVWELFADGEEAYCIEPGEPLDIGDVLKVDASATWDRLSAAKKNAIKLAFAFGKPGNAKGLTGSGDSKHVATQLIVWEIVCGLRNPSTFEVSDTSIHDSVCRNGYNSETNANYKAIGAAMKRWCLTPSFADGKVHEMSYKDGKYTLTLKDSNGVLEDYKVSCSDSAVKVSQSGNTLTLTSSSSLSKNATITLSKTSSIATSATLVVYGSEVLQDVMTGVVRLDDVSENFKVSTPAGDLKLVKTSEDGQVEGIKFTIEGNGITKKVTTDKDGNISVPDLFPGTYTVTETVSNKYEPQKAKEITIKDGETTTVKFKNVLKKGSISISKYGEVFTSVETTEDEMYRPIYEEQFLAGATYQIIADEDMYVGGEIAAPEGTVVEELTTDADGVVSTGDLYLGRYRIVEIQAPNGYVWDPEVHYVTLTLNGEEGEVRSVSESYVNDRQKLELKAQKVMDADDPAKIGMNDEILAVSFGLYAKEEITAVDGTVVPADGLIEIAYADAEGQIAFTTDLPFGQYYVKELTTDEHYLLDENLYEVSFEYCGQETPVQVITLGEETIVNYLMHGCVELTKVDKDYPENHLKGAVFGLYYDFDGDGVIGEQDTLVGNLNELKKGVYRYDNLPYGHYIVKELTAPEGYVLDENSYPFEIMEDGQKVVIENEAGIGFANQKIKGKLVISKVDADTEELLPDAGFRIYAEDGETVLMEARTDENGICEFELEYGHYYYQEFDAPEGYEIDDTKYEFSIDEDGQIHSVVMENHKKETPKKPHDVPQTGDPSTLGLWLALAAGSLICGIFAGTLRRKEEKE